MTIPVRSKAILALLTVYLLAACQTIFADTCANEIIYPNPAGLSQSTNMYDYLKPYAAEARLLSSLGPNAKIIDSGFDSTIYLVNGGARGAYLIKAYIELGDVMEHLSPGQGLQRTRQALQHYLNDVRTVAKALRENPALVSLPSIELNGEPYQVRVEIGDPGELLECGGVICSKVKNLVPGINLNSIHNFEVLELPDRGNPKRAFSVQRSAFELDPSNDPVVWKRNSQPLNYGITERLWAITQQLKKIPGGKHFDISEPNVKVHVDSKTKQIIFVITDAANQIRDWYGGAGPHPRS